MVNFEKQDGIAFFLIYYTHRDEFYYLPLEMLLYFWNRAKEGGRKSFRYEEVDKRYRIGQKGGVYCHYLEGLQLDLRDRAEAEEAVEK